MSSSAWESAAGMGGLVAVGIVVAHVRRRPRLGVGAIARGVAVGVFGALPATLLLVPALALGFNAADSLQYGRDVAFYTAATTWAVLALLGTIGLWLASVRPPDATTLAFVACGLLADGIVIADGLLTDPAWFVPRRFDRDAVELLLMVAPFVVGAAYVTSVLRARRAPVEASAASGEPGTMEAAQSLAA